MNMSRLAT